MKYVVKMVGTCPEGAVENVEYWIAESEAEMQAMISVQRELSYTGITCLGPVVEPNDFLREKIANNSREARYPVASKAWLAESEKREEAKDESETQ